MTAVVNAILGLSDTASTEEWLQQLERFNTENQNELTFVDRFGEKKRTLMERLVRDILNNPASWTPEVRTAALCVIRLCCREAFGLEPVSSPEFVTLLFQISGLSPAPEGKSWTESEQSEAAKGLVNLAMRDTAAFEKAFLERKGMESIIEKLKSPDTPKSMRFPFSRLVFLLALNESLCEKFNEQRAISVFTQILAESLTDISQPDNVVHATEAMKAIFKLSMYLGPLSDECKMQGQPRLPTPEQLDEFKTLIPHLLVVLKLPYVPAHQPLKEAVVNCLINVPAACTELFPQEETLGALIEILKFQVTLDVNPAGALTPILLVLTSIADAIPRARAILKKVVFPHSEELVEAAITVEAPKANLDENTIGAKLISHMTTFNVALKHYVNEFLFVLCDKDPNELVKMTGFGNAAGLLATHNLFQALSSGQATEVKMPSPKAPSNQELEREIQESVHGSSDPSVKTGKPMGFLDSLTEEEQEAEAERLGMLIEKLERQGVIKVLRKSDNDPDAGGSSTSSGSS